MQVLEGHSQILGFILRAVRARKCSEAWRDQITPPAAEWSCGVVVAVV